MRLVDLVSQETGADFSEILLLRHSTNIAEKLEAAGGSLEEYTNTQPIGSRYDYLAEGRTPISIVVVIVRDRVRGVYRVLGVEAEGNILSLVGTENRRFYTERGDRGRPARRFLMERVPS